MKNATTREFMAYAEPMSQPGFDITPAIRERALAGQALFTTDSRALPSLRKLTGEASPDMAMFDALRILGFDPGVSVEEESRTEDLGAPQRFGLGARTVLYNTAFPDHTRAADAQWMLEELLHASDAVGGNRAISATMTRLAPGGDIRTEVEDAYLTGPSATVARFLQYPLHPR